MSDFKSYRAHSRTDWGTSAPGSLDLQQINTGALLRIADATELMAKRYQSLIDECDQFKRSRDYWQNEAERRNRQLIAARGQITKLKNAAKAAALSPSISEPSCVNKEKAQ